VNGAQNYHSGLAAENAVARRYEETGYEIANKRWKSAAGEVDLIARKNGNVIFIEVKKSRTFGRAAESLSARQIARIYSSAEIFLADEPDGLNTDARFDVALVNDTGHISILENAICA